VAGSGEKPLEARDRYVCNRNARKNETNLQMFCVILVTGKFACDVQSMSTSGYTLNSRPAALRCYLVIQVLPDHTGIT